MLLNGSECNKTKLHGFWLLLISSPLSGIIYCLVNSNDLNCSPFVIVAPPPPHPFLPTRRFRDLFVRANKFPDKTTQKKKMDPTLMRNRVSLCAIPQVRVQYLAFWGIGYPLVTTSIQKKRRTRKVGIWCQITVLSLGWVLRVRKTGNTCLKMM